LIEARPYDFDLSDEERREIRARVSAPLDRLIVYREMVVQTPFTIQLMGEEVEALSQGWDRFVMVTDLAACKRPDAPSRAMLRRRVSRVVHRVAHLAIVVGGNVMISAMARLVAYSMGYRSVSLHDTLDDALLEARRVLAS